MTSRSRHSRAVGDADQAPPGQSRGAALGVASVLVVGMALAYCGSLRVMWMWHWVVDGALLLAWLLACLGWGGTALRPIFRRPCATSEAPLRVVTAAAMGMGLMGLAMLLLGLAAMLSRGATIAMVAIGALLALQTAVRLLRRAGPPESAPAPKKGKSINFTTPLQRALNRRAAWSWLWLLCVPALATLSVATLLPPGVLFEGEPNGYDVVEYHLQLPREWYEAGRIQPLDYNVFSYFPLNVEMHYLIAMELRGGPWEGMYLAQMMSLIMMALAVGAIYAVGRQLAPSGPGPIFAATLAATTPWLSKLAPIAYVEGGFLLYSTLAIGWMLCALRRAPGWAWKMDLALSGVMTGLACGAKLTAAPEILVALPAVMLACLMIQRARSAPALRADQAPLAHWIGGLAMYGAVALLFFSPWLIRDMAWAGNPIFPEGMSLFGRGHFTVEQQQRWQNAYLFKPPAQWLAAHWVARWQATGLLRWAVGPMLRLRAGWSEIIGNSNYGYVLIPFAIAAFWWARRRIEGCVLAGLLAALAVIWLGFTHLEGRFFVLAIPLCALLIALIPWVACAGGAILLGIVAAGLIAVFQVQLYSVFYRGRLGQTMGLSQYTRLIDLHDDLVPKDATLVLVGDSRAFLFQRPMRLLRYRTVFDVDSRQGLNLIDAWAYTRWPRDNSWIIVDTSELRRLQRTYPPMAPLPPNLPSQAMLMPPANKRLNTVPNAR